MDNTNDTNDYLKKTASTESFDIIDMPTDDNEHELSILEKPPYVDDVIDTISPKHDNALRTTSIADAKDYDDEKLNMMTKHETDDEVEPEITTDPEDLRKAILQMPEDKRNKLFKQIAKFQQLQQGISDTKLNTVEENNIENVRERFKSTMKQKKMQRESKVFREKKMTNMQEKMTNMQEQLQKISESSEKNLNTSDTNNDSVNTINANAKQKNYVNTPLGKSHVMPSKPISMEKTQSVINELEASEFADKMAAELIAEESASKKKQKSKKKKK